MAKKKQINTDNHNQFKYDAIIFRQTQEQECPIYAIFAAPVGEILKWAEIRRRSEHEDGHQRALNVSKVNAVTKFFTVDPKNSIPTSVVIVLNVDVGIVSGTTNPCLEKLLIRVHGKNKPGLIIDGQHRIFGMDKRDNNLLVSIVALLNASDSEAAFQFLVINNKSAKVSPDHIRTLALDYSKDTLEERLRKARITLSKNLPFVGLVEGDSESPFKGLVALKTTKDDEDKMIDPSAIEGAMSYIKEQRMRGLTEEEDNICQFFYAIWRPVKKAWPELWDASSALMMKAGILCMTQYLVDAVINKFDNDNFDNEFDILNPQNVSKYVSNMLKLQEREFWILPWKPSSYDNKVGKKVILDSLKRIARNKRAGEDWKKGITMLLGAGEQDFTS